jgi:hypothetical protein
MVKYVVSVLKMNLSVRYVLSSVLMYFAISFAMFIGVDLFKIKEIVCYALVYCVAYIADYVINLRIIFRTMHSLNTVAKYTLHIAFFYIINLFLFKSINSALTNYILTTWLVVFLLFPLRFLSYKYFVYKMEM